MTTKFYDTYKSFNKDELFKIVLSPDDYQPDAVIAAKQIIAERKWTDDLNKKLEERDQKETEEEKFYEQEVKEKAAYYKNVVEFKNQDNSFQVRIADIPKFEALLSRRNIEFYREDKNVGVQLDTYPTQTYFFKSKDAKAVDKITKDLGLVTAPYTDIKPFFGFEIKVTLIVIAVILLLIVLFN
ncbi:MAG: hypothetical protein ABI723_05030 [Bacteroidia bacterium]